MNPGYGGGLVGRHDPADSGKEGGGCIVFGLGWMSQKIFFQPLAWTRREKSFFPGTYEMNSNGFSEFLKVISPRCERLDQVVLAMESTGCYHINLFSFLTSQGIRTMVVNPLLIANSSKLSLRKTKTD
jgi:hypothetical protein